MGLPKSRPPPGLGAISCRSQLTAFLAQTRPKTQHEPSPRGQRTAAKDAGHRSPWIGTRPYGQSIAAKISEASAWWMANSLRLWK